MPGHRSGAATTRSRVDVVFALLIAGSQRGAIWEYVRKEAKWGVTLKQVDRYIATATQHLRAMSETDRAAALGMAKARRADLYLRARKVQDYKLCASIQADLDKLLGLYPAARTELSGPGGAPIEVRTPPPEITPETIEEYRRVILAHTSPAPLPAGPAPPDGVLPAPAAPHADGVSPPPGPRAPVRRSRRRRKE